GQRLWSIDREPQDTISPTDKELYYCLDVNDTIVIITSNYTLFTTNFPLLSQEEFINYFNNYEIAVNDQDLPYTAALYTDNDTLLFCRLPIEGCPFDNLQYGIIQSNEITINKYLRIGYNVDSILNVIGLTDILPILKSKSSYYIALYRPYYIRYPSMKKVYRKKYERSEDKNVFINSMIFITVHNNIISKINFCDFTHEDLFVDISIESIIDGTYDIYLFQKHQLKNKTITTK
ncbi:MAG: hypothetical protein J1F10_07380, partial [Muribaculaceae bacterium]|nr:hypothetical protein [Muribaculaceae bacterium]